MIAPHLDGGNNGLVDASALLWRLQLCETGSQRRWREVMGLWMRQRAIGNRAFDLVHMLSWYLRRRSSTRAAADWRGG